MMTHDTPVDDASGLDYDAETEEDWQDVIASDEAEL